MRRLAALAILVPAAASAQRTQKPPLHGQEWMAVTGKPLGATPELHYGYPRVPPEEPIRGLLSKEYDRARARLIDPEKNDPKVAPGDPYPFQGGTNPYTELLKRWHEPRKTGPVPVNTVDKEGWVVSITPSGGWIPAFIAGKSGIGLSQRMQSFVPDEAENPFGTFWGAAGNHGED